MKLTVNGEPRQVDGDALTVTDLLIRLGLGQRRVAVEVNRALVPRARHPEHPVADGDEVEIVHFVGGGA